MKISWRRFNFFNKAVAEGDGALTVRLGLRPEARCTASAYCELAPRADAATEADLAGRVEAACFFGDDDGGVYATDADLAAAGCIGTFEGDCLWLAAARVPGPAPGLKAVAKARKTCVVCGVGGLSGKYVVKAWEYDAEAKSATEIEEVELRCGLPTALALRSDGKLAAVGTADGGVLLVPLKRRKVAGFLRPVGGTAVTNLVFAEEGARGAAAAIFVATKPTAADGLDGGEVASYAVPGDVTTRTLWTALSDGAKWKGSAKRELENRGCFAGCASFDGAQLVVARADGLYFYTTEERGGATGIDGDKHALCCSGRGLVTVASHHTKSRRSEVHVYDCRNKRVAHFARLAQGQTVQHALAGGSSSSCASFHGVAPTTHASSSSSSAPALCSVLLVTNTGSVSRLDEKPTAEKLDALYRMNLYATAVEVAEAARVAPSHVMEIHRMYGDHLYKKCDWDGAVAEYVQTIGHLEPSYVITRFLDAQRVASVATYLEAAHSARAQGRLVDATSSVVIPVVPCSKSHKGDSSKEAAAATTTTRPELTALLIHCYAKLKDVPKLDRLVATAVEDERLRFDATAAMDALRDAGFIEHALELAKRRCEQAWYVQVQLERRDASAQDRRDALLLMADLPAEAQDALMRRHGKKLVTAFPDEATELLMKLCTTDASTIAPAGRADGGGSGGGGGGGGGDDDDAAKKKPALPPRAETFSHLFIDKPEYLRVFLEYIFRLEKRTASKELVNTLLELQLDDWAATNEKLADLVRKANDGDGGGDDPLIGLPGKGSSGGKSASASASSSSSSKPKHPPPVDFEQKRAELEAKLRAYEADALALLSDEDARYDRYHALVLVESRAFEPGRLYLYQHRMRRDDDDGPALSRGVVSYVLLKSYAKRGDVRSMIKVCRATQSELPWLQLLEHVAANDDTFYAKSDDLADVVRVADEDKVLGPQRIITECAKHAVPLDALRPYLQGQLERSFNDVRDERTAIAELRTSTHRPESAMRQEIHDLRVAAVHLLPNAPALAKSAAAAKYGTKEAALIPAVLYDADGNSGEKSDDDDEGRKVHESYDHANAALAAVDDEHRKWEQIKRSQRARAHDHEQFFKELDDEEQGGFDCIARYFGKGVIR